jgi:hypothetical protein
VSWASEAVGAIRKIVLIEDRVERVAGPVGALAEICRDLDRRLLRLEAKFELIVKLGAANRRTIPAKPRRLKNSRKTD